MKKLIYSIYIILFVIAFHLTLRYVLNEVYIGKYNNSNYDNGIVNFLTILNYPESYVAHYNKGNNYYNLNEYDNAIEEYNKALRTVKGDKRCKVIINLSLAKFQLIDVNNSDVRDKLIDIENTLLDSDCATTDNKGKNSEAQKFYNLIEELLNAKGGGQGKDDKKDEKDDNGDSKDDYEEIEKKLKEQQQQASDDRKNIKKENYDYYNGKSW